MTDVPAGYGDSNLRRRQAALDVAKQKMADLGVLWADVVEWALANGYMKADLGTLNPVVIDRYFDAHAPADGDLARMPLTPRQAKALQFIKDTVRDRGYPPALRELCEHIGLTSTSSAKYVVDILAARGYVRRDARVARGIVVLDTPEVAAG